MTPDARRSSAYARIGGRVPDRRRDRIMTPWLWAGVVFAALCLIASAVLGAYAEVCCG
jgi:hypothetical protein